MSSNKTMSIYKVFHSIIVEGEKDSLYVCNLVGGTV